MYAYKSAHHHSKLRLLALGLTLLIVAGTVIWWTRNHADQSTSSLTASQYTKGEQAPHKQGDAGNNTASQPQSSQDQPGDQKSNDGGGSAGSLIDPRGDFVSNHHPTISGTPGPGMTSVCTTTPGASCKVVFTKGSITKLLNSQITDRGGSTYWNWNINDLGLDAGTWHITATATLNGYTKSTNDALDLVVAQ